MGKHKKNQSKKIEKAIANVHTLINTLGARERPHTGIPAFTFFFDHPSLQLLQREHLPLYRDVLHALASKLIGDERTSLAAVEGALQHALVAACHPRDKEDTRTFDERREEAVAWLQKAFCSSPKPQTFFLPVDGLADEGLPLRVGGVCFRRLENSFVDEITAGFTPDISEFIQKQFNEHLVGKIVAEVDIEARDQRAARVLAERKVRLVIDCLNFVAKIAPAYPHNLALSGDIYTGTLAIGTGGDQLGTSHERRGLLGELSLPHLRDLSSKNNLGLARLEAMLDAPSPNEHQKRLLAAAGWAGRSTVAVRPDERFLLMAVALETATLIGAMPQDLTYQLRLRVAQILRSSGRNPEEVFHQVKDLYGIRSKIVHSGCYQVADADVWLLQSLSFSVVHHLLALPPFRDFKSGDDLREWFESSLWRAENEA